MAKCADGGSKFDKNIKILEVSVIKIPRKEIVDLWNIAGLEIM